jgi:hypothetical protein
MPELCLQCPAGRKTLAMRRGLCFRCYGRRLCEIKRGETSWAELEAAGLALPAQERGAAWRRYSERWSKARGQTPGP